MAKKRDKCQVKWIGKRLGTSNFIGPKYYSKFCYKNIEAELGDFILVPSNSSSPKSDVVRILELFEDDMYADEPFRMKVRRFMWPKQLPKNYSVANDMATPPSFHELLEVIEDTRDVSHGLCVESVLGRCAVVTVATSKSVSQVAENNAVDEMPTYVCRYRLGSMAGRPTLHRAVDPDRSIRTRRMRDCDILADLDNDSDDEMPTSSRSRAGGKTSKNSTSESSEEELVPKHRRHSGVKPLNLAPRTSPLVSKMDLKKSKSKAVIKKSKVEPSVDIASTSEDEVITISSDDRESPKPSPRKTQPVLCPLPELRVSVNRLSKEELGSRGSYRTLGDVLNSMSPDRAKKRPTEEWKIVRQSPRSLRSDVDNPNQIVLTDGDFKGLETLTLRRDKCQADGDEARAKIASEASPSTRAKITSEASQSASAKITSEASQSTRAKIASEASQSTRAKITSEASHSARDKITSEASQSTRAKIASEASQSTRAKITSEASQSTRDKITSKASQSTRAKISSEASHSARDKITSEASHSARNKTPSKEREKDKVCDVVVPGPSRSQRQLRNRSSLAKTVDDDSSDSSYSSTGTPAKKKKKNNCATPKSSTKKISEVRTPSSVRKTPKSVRVKLLTPSMPRRDSVASTPATPLEEVRARLHVSAVPQALPCRDVEFGTIYNFLAGKIQDEAGGCMYISGVPGTGKTATVRQVVKTLQQEVSDGELPAFNFVEINGMKMTEPRQAYVQILSALTNEKLTADQALRTLEKRFTGTRQKKTTLLIVDELDLICNKRQDVVYNLLDWPSKAGSLLVVVTIANTMDLPETMLKGRVTSRLGLTRLTFKPYSFKQLQEIVAARLTGLDTFDVDAVQLVARKVASISGDARRALDVCRRATEMAESDQATGTPSKTRRGEATGILVTMRHVEAVMEEMVSSCKIQAIRSLSSLEKLFLRAVAASVEQCGDDQTDFKRVYHNIHTLAVVDGIKLPSVTELLHMTSGLSSLRLILSEHSRVDIRQKIMLNADTDEIHFALNLRD